MNKENLQNFLRSARTPVAGAFALGLIACSRPGPADATVTAVPRTPESTPTLVVPSATARAILTLTPSPSPLSATPRPSEAAPTPVNPFEIQDRTLRRQIEQAQRGNELQLVDAVVGHIIRYTWQGKETYIATIGISENNRFRVVAATNSAGCIYESLNSDQRGDAIMPGVWKVNTRVPLIIGKVAWASATNSPIPIVNSLEVINNGQNYKCLPEDSIERNSEIAKDIKWADMPLNDREFPAWYDKEIRPRFRG